MILFSIKFDHHLMLQVGKLDELAMTFLLRLKRTKFRMISILLYFIVFGLYSFFPFKHCPNTSNIIIYIIVYTRFVVGL